MTPERWREVESVLQAALDRDPAERSRYVAEACGADDALRREVESLLAGVTGGGADAGSPDRRFAAALAGRYALEHPLGAGGMATVYLAGDVRHHRKVAVKVLHPDLSAVLGTERFLKEIEVTAALQHPHILPLFDSGEAGGRLYYVMPLIDGETLRARLEREGPLLIADALGIAREVADALQYAHDHGVIHRDVKPENILLQGGHALVADFGIALAVEQAGGARLTRTGLSLGTPQYMAPEQAAGERRLDARVDVYALGAVLYEMLAGQPPFAGPTAQAVVARVVTESPRPLVTLRPSTPPAVVAAVETALAKLPADRFASARDFAAALSAPNAAAAPSPPRAAPRRTTATLGALFVLSTAAALWGWLRPRPTAPDVPPSRLAVVAPDLANYGTMANQRCIALTPDGGTLVYVARAPDGRNQLALRPLDAVSPKILGTHEAIGNPVVTADGRAILATTAGVTTVFRYAVDGGSEEHLAGTTLTDKAAWGPDGSLWSSADAEGRGLVRYDSDGTAAHPLGGAVNDLHFQDVLPDGRHALVTRSSAAWPNGPALLLDLRTGERTPLIDTPVIEIHYAAGYLVYVRPPDRALLAVAFDIRRRRTVGPPVELATDIAVTGSGAAQLAVARNGTVAYIAVDPFSLVRVGRDGSQRLITPERRRYHGPRLSPDGRRVAVQVGSVDGSDIWLASLDDGTLTRATFDRRASDAVWSRDGQFITYTAATGGGVLGLYRKRPDDTAPIETLLAMRGLEAPGAWLRDGTTLVSVVSGLRPGSLSDVALVRNGGRGPVEPLLATQFAEAYPALSPDDRWLAFVSDQSGRQEVYVRPLFGGEQVQVSTGGGTEPAWSPDGGELFYRTTVDTDPQMMAATMRVDGPRIGVAGRHALFGVAELLGSAPHANYDVSPDGQSFVMVRWTPPTHITVIQNLPALVERLRGRGGAPVSP